MQDPFESASIVTDKNFSEITAANAPGATQPNAGAQPAAAAENTGDPLTQVLLTDAPHAAQPAGESDAADVIPDWINQIPEAAATAQANGGEEDLILDEVTTEDEAFIQAATTPEEFSKRTQQVKKRIHDVNSARIGKFKAQQRALQAEMQAYQRLVASGKSLDGAAGMQSQPAAQQQEQPRGFQAGPQAAGDFTQLPEYAARARAKATMDSADQETYVQARDAYEKANDDFTRALARMERDGLTAQIEAEKVTAKAFEVDRQLDQQWKGDPIRPIPWADSTDANGRVVPGVKTLFGQLVQADPTLPQRIPNASPVERAKWMASAVSEAFPRLHVIHAERVRASLMKQTQKKIAAAPTVSGQTNPIKNAPAGPQTLTGDYLNYINQGQRGG